MRSIHTMQNNTADKGSLQLNVTSEITSYPKFQMQLLIFLIPEYRTVSGATDYRLVGTD